MKRTLHITLLCLAAPSAVSAQVTNFTEHCTDETSVVRRERIREAHAFVHDHLDQIWEEIRRGIAFGSPNYTFISETRRERYEGEIGEVRVNCENSGCDSNPNRLGRCTFLSRVGGTSDPSDRIILCLDNITSIANSMGSQPFPVLAGTLAHEVMHQCDGLERHPSPGGVTNPSNPQTDAETIGVAVEHLLLTPDVRILSIETEQVLLITGEPRLRARIVVENVNPYSGTGSTTALSGIQRNTSFRVGLYVNGTLIEEQGVSALAAGGRDTVDLYMDLTDGHDPSRAGYDVHVLADSGDVLFELDETNNEVSQWFSPTTNVAITRFELAGPYEDTYFLGGGTRKVTFDVEVMNRSTRNMTSSFDIEFVAPRAFPGGRCLSVLDRVTVANLDPGETTNMQVDAILPLDSTGEVSGSWSVDILVDPDEDLLDPDRGDNEAHLLLSQDWFRPDYTVTITSLDISEERDVLVTCVVRNIGPEPGRHSHVSFELSDGTSLRHRIQGLDVLQSLAVQFETSLDFLARLQSYEIEVRADVEEVVDENDESNNVASGWFRMGVDLEEVIRSYLGRALVPREVERIDDSYHAELSSWLAIQLETHPAYVGNPSASGPIYEIPTEAFLASTVLGAMVVIYGQWPAVQPTTRSWASTERSSYLSLQALTAFPPSVQEAWR